MMQTMNGSVFLGMLESGCNNLNNRKKEIDALNVFPVPDGDTGTNMSLTMNNGISEARKSGSEQLPVLAKTFSRGLLMGARGNSGVILSQIFRGFYQSVGEQNELDPSGLATALSNGSKLAYKAVMRPVEGTILTVVREASDAGVQYVEQHGGCSLNELMDVVCKEARASLDHTPELLPILKEARVVDSGGSGLCAILEGFRAYLQGTPISAESQSAEQSAAHHKSFGYRAEFILRLGEQEKHLFREDKFRTNLSRYGKNPTMIIDGDLVKVRIETMMPGEVLNLGQRYGEFQKVQIENLQGELAPSILEEESAPKELREYGIITTAAGEGLAKLFKGYRADVVISGGQTMNPATEDFVSAIQKTPARHIYVLPNNSNIIMAAQQAAEVTEDKDIIVLPTRSIPEGLSACMAFNPEESLENNTANMKAAAEHIKSGEVTYAIKDTVVGGLTIHKGDYMGLFGKSIAVTAADKVEVVCELLKKMVDEDSEIITLILGRDATEEESRRVQEFISDQFDLDVDVEQGDQPVYSFLIGVE